MSPPWHTPNAVSRFPPILGLALCLTGAPAVGQAQERYRWTLADTIDGCQLEMSQVASKDYVAARSTCVFPVNIEVVGAVLRDIENYPQWMEDCSETKLLKVVDRGREIYVFWYRQHIPAFTDRDMVLRSELTVNQDIRRVVEAAMTVEVPYDSGKGYVRMGSFRAQWVLEKQGEHQTRVTYMIDPDLRPGLPLGLANATIELIPFRSLRRMMMMVKLPKYVDGAKALTAATDHSAVHAP